jgi:hypothetical protein
MAGVYTVIWMKFKLLSDPEADFEAVLLVGSGYQAGPIFLLF